MSIVTLQLLTALAWILVGAIALPGTFRLFFGAPRYGDQSKSAFFFTALIFVGGNTRWLLAPDDLFSWKLVYVLSILLAAYICVIAWNLQRDHP